jgi:hypothetical protein
MSYKSCKADPDLWLKEETRPSDNTRYYAYILCYVDDILVINHDPMSVLGQINGYLPLKPTSIGDPDPRHIPWRQAKEGKTSQRCMRGP